MPSVLEMFSAFPFDSATRLHRLEGDGEQADLLVESWACQEAISRDFELQISTLSTRAGKHINAMTGRRIELQIVLVDGSLKRITGVVTQASSEAADGGFPRYSLTARPWIALLAHTRQSRVWQ